MSGWQFHNKVVTKEFHKMDERFKHECERGLPRLSFQLLFYR